MSKRSVRIHFHQWFKLLFLIFFVSFFCIPAMAAAVTFQSSEIQTSLLEFYTSEGCSSCPPAEQWFSTLKTSLRLWKDFVPVAFHVDYWNYLGWPDPWSSKVFTDRQRAYARTWRNDSVYTPGFVLNGKEWRARPRSQSALASTARTGILRVTSFDLRNYDATFTPATHSTHSYEVHAALLASHLVSDVKAGENKGRRLEHDFVVIWLKAHLLMSDGTNAHGKFELELRYDRATSNALAFWITRLGQLEPIQAAGGWLPSSH